MAVVVGEAAVRIRPDVDEGEFSDKVKGPIGDALGKAGEFGAEKLTAAFGGALAIGAAFSEAMDQAALGDKLSAQLGATGQYAEDLGSIAGDLYANAYGDSLGSVNDALRSVIQSGAVMEDASNEQLQSVTASAMDLASAFDVDVGEAANAAGRLVQTGLAANAEEALDIVTRGFQQGADRGGDFLDVLGEYGTTFSELGLTGAQATGLINQALAAGIPNADFAADALREMGIIGREGSDTARTAIESLGLSADDYFGAMQAGGPAASAALDTVLDALRNTEDPATRSAAAVALVGTQYEDLGDTILSLDPSEAVGSLGQIEGAAGKMGQTLNDNAQTNMTTFMRTAQQAFVNVLGGQVIPLVEGAASILATVFGPAIETIGSVISGTVIPAFQSLGGFIADHSTTFTIVAAVIAAVFVPALIAMGLTATASGIAVAVGWATTAAAALASLAGQSFAIASSIAGWVSMAAVAVVNAAIVVGGWVLMGAQALLGAARMAAAWLIAMGPIALVIAAVIGIVALIVANWDTIVNATKVAWTAVVAFVSGIPAKIVAGLAALGAMIAGVATAAWQWFYDNVVTKVGELVAFVGGLPGKIVAAVGNLGSLLVQKGKDLIQGLVNGIGQAAGYVGNVAKNIVNGVIGFINNSVIDGLNNMLEFTILGVHVDAPDIPHIPRLHSGGVFDSGQGEGLALLSDDELVATPVQRKVADDLLRGLLAGRLDIPEPAPAAGASQPVEVNVYPSPGMDERILAAHVVSDLSWQLTSGATRPVPLLGAPS